MRVFESMSGQTGGEEIKEEDGDVNVESSANGLQTLRRKIRGANECACGACQEGLCLQEVEMKTC